MNQFSSDGEWLTIQTHVLRHCLADTETLRLLRSVVFHQMLEPPLFDGRYTVIEGRMARGAEKRLVALGFRPRKSVHFADDNSDHVGRQECKD